MRHYVLTRSSFAPEVGLDEIRFRLELLRRICVPSLQEQTDRNWGWIVLINPKDPVLEERTAILKSANAPWLFVRSSEDMIVRGGPDAPRGPWAKPMRADQSRLTTRLDDDDALAPNALETVRRVAKEWEKKGGRRHVFSFSDGWRVMGPMAERVTYDVPTFSSLYSPRGDKAIVNDVAHLSAKKLAPLTSATHDPMWMWIRHDVSRSHQNMRRDKTGKAGGMLPHTEEMRATFPTVDWDFVESIPQKGEAVSDMKYEWGKRVEAKPNSAAGGPRAAPDQT